MKKRRLVMRRVANQVKRNPKLKPEMTREEIDRKIEQSARGYDSIDEPDVADEVMEMEPEEFLEFVGREDVKITNPLTRRLLRRKLRDLKRERSKLTGYINRIQRAIGR